MNEKDIEDAASGSLGRHNTSSTINETTGESINGSREGADGVGTMGIAKDEETRYESIRPHTGASATRTTSRPIGRTQSGRSMRSISHVRSHNGYGCDDLDESSDETANDVEAQPREKDPFEVGFDGGGPDDPWYPRNMSTMRKWMIVALTSLGSFCVTCASSIYTSTYTQMDAEFHTSHIVATLGLSMFVLGIALGPMWSPLSEFYGRRPIYLAAFAAFTVWIIPCAVAQNIETVIISRFFQGLAGSAFLSVSGGTVGDLFRPEQMHHPMTLFTAAPFLGPSFGPMIGGFINYNVSWRWTHYVLIIWAFCMCIALVILVPETYHPVVLRNKAKKMRKDTGDDRWKAPIEKSTKSLVRTVGRSLMRPFQILIFEPMALVLNLYSAILLGILYLFFGAFPLVFEGVFGFNLWQTGLTFMGMLVGMLIAGSMGGIWVKIRAKLIMKNEAVSGIEGKSEPEFRLPSAIVGSWLVTIGLFWFGWTTFSTLHWILPIIGSAIFGAGTLLVFSGTFTYLVDAYPLYAASALAANAFVRCAFAADFFCQWATSLLAFLTVAMLPFPYIFFRYGKKIRAHSRMATTD
ncbi:putative drug/proton antiporter YHK8 [Cytospora mali]|uniref:Drug/proton antiporter YHK8 n=1 Tax=Cytospora mali TaxID=578113 RepID=A0A194UN32_CYTMA|nr:putative drug/proton antiporter YHK8 [Valsa mali var. pyri (nom. inval.)]